MKRYYLRLAVESPVSISGHSNIDGQTTPGLDYIPGSTLRGALVWHWLRQHPGLQTSVEFVHMVDEGGLRCTPLYPYSGDAYHRGSQLALVLPTTARTCKHAPGFVTDLAEKASEDAHGVRDSLVALIEERALEWQAALQADGAPGLAGLQPFEHCQFCRAPMTRYQGYYEQGEFLERANYWRSQPHKRLITRSQILPQLQATVPGNLYSREALQEGQLLAGWVLVDDGLEAWMQETLGDGSGIIANGESFYVGAARTAGFGRVRVDRCERASDIWSRQVGDFDSRVDRFQARLAKDLRSQWALVPITLLSDAILLDAHLRHTSALKPAVLASYQRWDQALVERQTEDRDRGEGPPPWPQGMKLFIAAANLHRVAGWNTAEGGRRPRSDDWAVAAGSVFVLAAPPATEAQLRRACRWLEEHGIGERRTDGFGQVLAAHPFHSLEQEV
jgi:CRISPR-associated protein Csx10